MTLVGFREWVPGVLLRSAVEVLSPTNAIWLEYYRLHGKQGASTTCYLATSPQVNGVSGQYFKDSNLYPHVSSYANDPELAAKLWDYSEEFVSTH